MGFGNAVLQHGFLVAQVSPVTLSSTRSWLASPNAGHRNYTMASGCHRIIKTFEDNHSTPNEIEQGSSRAFYYLAAMQSHMQWPAKAAAGRQKHQTFTPVRLDTRLCSHFQVLYHLASTLPAQPLSYNPHRLGHHGLASVAAEALPVMLVTLNSQYMHQPLRPTRQLGDSNALVGSSNDIHSDQQQDAGTKSCLRHVPNPVSPRGTCAQQYNTGNLSHSTIPT